MTTQFCNYTLLNQLGSGGVSTVYRAQTRDGQVVALKMLAPHLGGDTELSRRFFGNPPIYPQHLNIVQIYDIGACDGVRYIAMQLIEGESLESLLWRTKILSPKQFYPILEDVCEALDAVHKQGIIHCNIKPNKILLRASDGQAFLTNFMWSMPLHALQKDTGRMVYQIR